MKPIHAIAGVAVVGVAVGTALFLHSPVNTQQSPQCDASLWNHVYPGDTRRFKTPQDRLKVITACVTVTGTLVDKKSEPDGDEHIQLDVDDKSLLNAKNLSEQNGHLVVEPVCQNKPTQKDTVEEKACVGFDQTLTIPPMGVHVAVTGAFIEDQEHGWREIHPVTSITKE